MDQRTPLGPLLVGGILAMAIAMGVGRFAYTPILPAMQGQTGLGDAAAGVLASLNYAGYFLGALVVGRVPRGSPRTWVFRVSLVGSVTTALAMGMTESLWLWGGLRLVSGLASAGLFILGSAMVLDRLAHAGAGGRSGLVFSGVGLGIAASGGAVALLGPADWRTDWLVLGGACAVLAVPVWRWVQDQAPAAEVAAPEAGRRGPWPVLLVLLAVAYFCEGAGYIVTGTFLVAALKRVPELAALGELSWVLVGLAAAPSGVLWTLAGRRLGFLAALVLAHAVQAAGIALPALSPSPAAALASALLFGSTFIGIVALALPFGRALAPAGRTAPVLGALTAAYGLGQILGPLPAGMVLAASGGFEPLLLGAAGVVLLGALILVAGALLTAGRGRRWSAPGPTAPPAPAPSASERR